MNTPLENTILDLLHLVEHYEFTERHGGKLSASDAVKHAVKLCEKRLQEEADTIAEAYNAAGGPCWGSHYFEELFRSGDDAAKSLAGYQYAIKTSEI
jgi:hypothetical protein